jgi:hypothetical protein
MKKGEQAWNCYGARTNLYLLINYGFCFLDNLNDSFAFGLKLDLDVKPTVYPSIADMTKLKGQRRETM